MTLEENSSIVQGRTQGYLHEQCPLSQVGYPVWRKGNIADGGISKESPWNCNCTEIPIAPKLIPRPFYTS